MCFFFFFKTMQSDTLWVPCKPPTPRHTPDPRPARIHLCLLGLLQEALWEPTVSQQHSNEAGWLADETHFTAEQIRRSPRGSRSQIEVCVNDSSNSLSCVMLTARLSWINSDAHSRPGIWFQMEHKSGRWNVQFCCSFEEAYWEFVPVLL